MLSSLSILVRTPVAADEEVHDSRARPKHAGNARVSDHLGGPAQDTAPGNDRRIEAVIDPVTAHSPVLRRPVIGAQDHH